MPTEIPQFNNKGYLPAGVHTCSTQQFIDRFLFNSYRERYKKAITDIFDYAKERNAEYVFIGGSFVSNNDKPADFDCLIAFSEDKNVPEKTEVIKIEDIHLDIQYLSLEHETIIHSYIKLFSNNRFGLQIGIIMIDLYDENCTWEIQQYLTDEYEIVKRAYINRKVVECNEPKGVLVSIHGLLSKAKWNMELAPISSSQKWIFAPYIYEDNKPDLLVNKNHRDKTINDFREWIYDLHQRFPYPISIIAHSYGTYLITAYLCGFDNYSPVCFNSIILTGSIIKRDLDWDRFRGKSVGRVLNIIAPDDDWVKLLASDNLKKIIRCDPLMGDSGSQGFSCESEIIVQEKNSIFNHNNVIKRDIINGLFMPFFNSHCDILQQEGRFLLEELYSSKKDLK